MERYNPIQPGLMFPSPEQIAELVAVYSEDIVNEARKVCHGKGYGATAITCEELSTISEEKGGKYDGI